MHIPIIFGKEKIHCTLIVEINIIGCSINNTTVNRKKVYLFFVYFP